VWTGDVNNVNQFGANWGNDMINGTATHVFGANWITRTVGGSIATGRFCNDAVGGQVASKVYYVYYATYNADTELSHVISTIAPNPTGEPSANLVFTIDGHAENHKKAVFLGSYMTDALGNMIPFDRSGEEVMLTNRMQIGPALGVTFPAGGAGYPMTQVLPIGANVLPKTASAAIVEFLITSGALAAPPATHDIFVLDPWLAVATVNPYAQLDLLPTANTTVQYDQARVRVYSNQLPLGAINLNLGVAPGGPITVKAYLAGYVEPFHHLDKN
jgi:hypothetical protein